MEIASQQVITRNTAVVDDEPPSSVMAQALGRYREFPVSGPLAEHFLCRWSHQLSPTGATAMVVVPDGCVDLIWADGGLRVAGPDRVFQAESVTSDGTIAGLRFQPGAAASWLGLPVSEIVNRRLSLAELWGAEAVGLADEIGSTAETADPGLGLEAGLTKRLARVKVRDHRLQAAFELLTTDAGRGDPVVPWLMSELGMSERTLRRYFDDALGYGPKTLDRILRFQRFLRLARAGNNPVTIARLAMAAGYADQAHLTRECRRLAGLTPVQIVGDFLGATDKPQHLEQGMARATPGHSRL